MSFTSTLIMGLFCTVVFIIGCIIFQSVWGSHSIRYFALIQVKPTSPQAAIAHRAAGTALYLGPLAFVWGWLVFAGLPNHYQNINAKREAKIAERERREAYHTQWPTPTLCQGLIVRRHPADGAWQARTDRGGWIPIQPPTGC